MEGAEHVEKRLGKLLAQPGEQCLSEASALPTAHVPSKRIAAPQTGLRAVARLYAHRKHRTLIFVSRGGTCRDPMAKAIAKEVFEKQGLRHPLDIRAAALGPLTETSPSHAARQVIKEMYGSGRTSSKLWDRPFGLEPHQAIGSVVWRRLRF
jgi:hypothetical protein